MTKTKTLTHWTLTNLIPPNLTSPQKTAASVGAGLSPGIFSGLASAAYQA